MKTILAPHVDDETIGCFSLLSGGAITNVIYFFDVDAQRKQEAINASKYFDFNPLFAADMSLADIDAVCRKSDSLYMPAITDSHEHHKKLNRKYRQSLPADKGYYSVDLDRCAFAKTTLPFQVMDAKRTALDSLYPSQARLWANNESYYLFESIVAQDFMQLKTYSFHDIQIVSDKSPFFFSSSPKAMFDSLISEGATYVSITKGNEIWRTV